ncbi:calcineurin-like phosphoesterase C-terminal domain-containing protein [Arenimonas sp. MALMAid1274]|uniref:calcineurin-like phosphoesterase C-terminal domain-containing protein n=1 Tax=Arenimonas sp. MALMAid1274 TaxID=3411630 RepID=UPI003B9E8964
MRPRCLLLLIALLSVPALSAAAPAPMACATGLVFDDRDGDGRQDRGEPGLRDVAVGLGASVVRTDAQGRFPLSPNAQGPLFVIKPAGWRVPPGSDGLPGHWRPQGPARGEELRYGGRAAAATDCPQFALRRDPRRAGELDVLLFGDPQPKTAVDVGYYERDIVERVLALHSRPGRDGRRGYVPASAGDLGLTLGDIVSDDLSLYPAMNRATARLRLPWLHVAGNHDLDFDATRDEDSLLSFQQTYGPDTYAWEEHEASFVLLDDVIYRPGQKPAYIGGLREDQFAFLAAYLPTLPRERLLVLAVHIPFFDEPGEQTFRRADRERLFAMLRPFPNLLLLSAHGHKQRHHFHGAADGWQGASPLHEYNLGAACGAYWSGVKDGQGIPDARMADGTPNGWGRLTARQDGRVRLSWQVAGADPAHAIGLTAPKVLRRGAYPGYGVFANVYMGRPDTVVEYRINEGAWQPMQKVDRPDPALVAENLRDDEAADLRGFDRSPEAEVSTHLWRGTLPTHLPAGEHRIQVRSQDPWRGEVSAERTYRLQDAAE